LIEKRWAGEMTISAKPTVILYVPSGEMDKPLVEFPDKMIGFADHPEWNFNVPIEFHF
jgi:hypothetical protein